MAALVRGTPNFTAPPSQNTAPVDEFRCLYTHDIRKKQKKWHDGTVKFHTFNRRVMVYDDVRNYVGDLHYRADEQFGEGVELQLDRGVMVEVGEPLGQTQTDVTALVNRGNARGDNTHVNSTSATGPQVRRTNADTQGRPKSLAEVLGASQGRHGRARLPLQSPFEQRRSLEETCPEQSPMKKQKTVSVPIDRPVVQPTSTVPHPIGKENIPVQRKPLPKKQSASANTTYQRPGSSTARAVTKSSTQPIRSFNPRTVVDLSSEEENDPELERANDRGTDGRKNGKQRTISNASNPASTAQPIKPRQKAIERRAANDKSKQPMPERQIRPSTAPSESTKMSKLSSREGSATLRFVASSKPRPKLMYKALLPSSTSQKSLPPPPHSSCQSGDRHDEMGLEESRIVSEGVTRDDSGLFETGLEDMDVDSPDTGVTQLDLTRNELPENSPSNEPLSQGSPLFVSQAEPHQISSSPPSYLPEDGSFGISFTQELCNIVDSNIPEAYAQRPPSPEASTPRTLSPAPSDLPVYAAAPVSNRESPRGGITEAKVAITPGAILSPTRPSNIPAPTSARQFRRVVSENDSNAFVNPNPTSPQSPFANSLPSTETPTDRRPPPLLPAPNYSPSLLSRRHNLPLKQLNNHVQRSFSETQAIIPQPLEIETADTSLKQTDEQGPWTKLEAFLLFETWPDSKKQCKPIFEKRRKDGSGDDEDDDENEIDNGKRSTMNNFRSARMVLRDEQ